ncbi:coiled-coil domain-containing protein [Paraphaeosphaeria sporulosa]
MPYLCSANMHALAIRSANGVPEDGSAHPRDSADGDMAMAAVEDVRKADGHDTSTEDGRAARARRLKAKNRRKRYLDVHPEYFADASLELADPLLYDRLIRRFQTAAEREAEGRRKGFSGQMATDLWRVEAKKDALSHPSPASLFTYTRGPQGEIHEADKDEVPMSKDEGRAWWKDEMTQRFLRGDDDDFDYDKVDASHAYDDPEEERDIQDAYFDSMESDFDTDGEGKEKVLTGETGIQDY